MPADTAAKPPPQDGLRYAKKLEFDEVESALVRCALEAFGADYDAKSSSTIRAGLARGAKTGPFYNQRGTEFLTISSGQISVNGLRLSPGEVIRIDAGEIVEIVADSAAKLMSHVFPYADMLYHLPFAARAAITDAGPAPAHPLVTIVIIAKDIEHYICHAVNSCLNQTYSNLQVIVVDDGSSDHTSRKASCMAAFDPRLEVHIQPLGRNQVRHYGLGLSRGEYCLIIDGDDWLNIDAIEKLVDTALETDADCVAFGYEYYSDSKRTVWSPVYVAEDSVETQYLYDEKTIDAADQISVHNHTIWMYFFSVRLKSRLLDALIDVHLYEDLPFYMAILQYSKVTAACNYVLYHYRRDRVGQATSNWNTIPAGFKCACLTLSVESILERLGMEDRWFYEAILYYKIRNIIDHEWTVEKTHGNEVAATMWEHVSDEMARKFPADLEDYLTGEHRKTKFRQAHLAAIVRRDI